MDIGIDKDLGGNRSLRDEFAIPDSDDANDISAALYKEELNDRKIEKLGNRVTLISILLPCLIGVILVYSYLDIKKRVMLIHNSGQTQVDVVAKEFESKLNAIEVELAKIKFVFEKDIPELKQQTIAIQDELTLLAGSKADKEEIEKNLEIIKADIAKTADQYQGALHILDRTNQETLTIVNEKSKEIEVAIEEKITSLKTIEADIKAKVASLKTVEANIEANIASISAIEGKIDNKIDSRANAAMEKRLDVAMDKRIKTVINEKLAAHNQTLDKKVADIDLSVESKLATLQEVTQILTENKTTITRLEGSIGGLEQNVGLLNKELKNYQLKVEKDIAAKEVDKKRPDIDKQYVDAQIITLKKSINAKIGELDLNLSRKILQYATQSESSIKGNNSDSKKKTNTTKQSDTTRSTESIGQENRSEIILQKPERGKISETDLTQ